MLVHGARLEKKQAMLFRAVDIGADLFAMSATVSRAAALSRAGSEEGRRAEVLADLFCRNARRRIAANFRALRRNDDDRKYRVARQVLQGDHRWLEKGVLFPGESGNEPVSSWSGERATGSR